MNKPPPQFPIPDDDEQKILDSLQIHLSERADVGLLGQFSELMCTHHYLESDILVDEQLRHVVEVDGNWLALLSWSAAYHPRDREEWIRGSYEQLRRRLALVANKARFLILPGVDCPNLASRALALCCDRLSAD